MATIEMRSESLEALGNRLADQDAEIERLRAALQAEKQRAAEAERQTLDVLESGGRAVASVIRERDAERRRREEAERERDLFDHQRRNLQQYVDDLKDERQTLQAEAKALRAALSASPSSGSAPVGTECSPGTTRKEDGR